MKPQWVRFGRELRRLRTYAGLSQQQLGKEVAVSYGLISAFERGIRGPKPEHVEQIDKVLSTGGSLFRMWETLSASSGLASWFRGVVALEQQASEIREYNPMLVPGLLQTESYARTILRDGQSADTDAEIEEQVQARLERQSLLSSQRPPLVFVVLDEAVLRRSTGGREIMSNQLGHLLEASAGSRIVVQVVPMATEHHPGLSEAFQLITTPETGEILYMETRISGTPVEAPEGVAEYVRLFGDLRGAALPELESRKLLEKIRGEFE